VVCECAGVMLTAELGDYEEGRERERLVEWCVSVLV